MFITNVNNSGCMIISSIGSNDIIINGSISGSYRDYHLIMRQWQKALHTRMQVSEEDNCRAREEIGGAASGDAAAAAAGDDADGAMIISIELRRGLCIITSLSLMHSFTIGGGGAVTAAGSALIQGSRLAGAGRGGEMQTTMVLARVG
jgi:hypothetical protein